MSPCFMHRVKSMLGVCAHRWLLSHFREFIGTRLLDWAKKYEHVSVKTVLKRNHHPFLMAEYGKSPLLIHRLDSGHAT